jgi:hypothetical protein
VLSGKERWDLRRGQSRLMSAVRSVVKCALSGSICSGGVREAVNIFALRDKLNFYSRKWAGYPDKFGCKRLSKYIRNYPCPVRKKMYN